MTQLLGPPETTRENWMVVVRETTGVNRPEDSFRPVGPARFAGPDGRMVEVDLAQWDFIGDTHMRFVFDAPQPMVNATLEDLERLGIRGGEAPPR